MNVADLPQTDVTATTVDIRTDATSLPASAEAQSELRKVTVEQSIIESLGLTSFEIMAVESLQDDAPIASVAPITATEEAAATEETPTVTVSASAPAPMYRVVDKEISQSTAVSTEEGAHSSQFSQGEANGSLPSPRSPKKGWPNSSVKQSVSRSLTGRGPESIYKKPAHSYSSLITEAVRMSIKGQMTLNEIYCWLIEKFPYFRAAGTGWKVGALQKVSL